MCARAIAVAAATGFKVIARALLNADDSCKTHVGVDNTVFQRLLRQVTFALDGELDVFEGRKRRMGKGGEREGGRETVSFYKCQKQKGEEGSLSQRGTSCRPPFPTHSFLPILLFCSFCSKWHPHLAATNTNRQARLG